MSELNSSLSTVFNLILCSLLVSGTHIAYSAEAEEVNVRICPFIFMPTMASYSLLWVTQPISEGALIVREHTLGKNAPNAAWKTARMLPWEPQEIIGGYFLL